MRRIVVLALAVSAAMAVLGSCGREAQSARTPTESAAEPPRAANAAPARVGDCVDTIVAWTGSRLEGMPESGSAIEYANGVTQVSYDVVTGMQQSRVGDPVRVCLVSVPEDCPPGDDRGRVYSATNARTGAGWSAPDSQHSCGGA